MRPFDRLIVFRKTLLVGSVRLQIYDTHMRLARITKRLPAETTEVYDEIIVKLQRAVRETKIERQERVDKEFQELRMGRWSHAEFKVKFEALLLDFQEEKVGTYRKYAVLGKLWILDSEDAPSRKPRTWEEVADCVEQELESRIDAKVPSCNGPSRDRRPLQPRARPELAGFGEGCC